MKPQALRPCMPFCLIVSLVACAQSADGEYVEASAQEVTGAIKDGTTEATIVLRVANTATAEDLEASASISRRASENIRGVRIDPFFLAERRIPLHCELRRTDYRFTCDGQVDSVEKDTVGASVLVSADEKTLTLRGDPWTPFDVDRFDGKNISLDASGNGELRADEGNVLNVSFSGKQARIEMWDVWLPPPNWCGAAPSRIGHCKGTLAAP